ncbi:TonB-dependent receptor [Sphingosinithalassobacter portus]|uniref:TonB-dependent receptor n=1 Tax=Stakelama portus TaxID=2676234 RepID=UPI000D6DD3F7|nr:TonB-dependent receptor [Sphingosinithalassobacter portus]
MRAGTALRALALIGAGAGAAVAFAAPAAAQDYTRGTLSGTVVDQAGVPVSGASVSITSNEQGFTNTAMTDGSGAFRINGLPTGTYQVTITRGGSVIASDPSVRVVAGQTNPSRYVAVSDSSVAVGDEITVVGQRVEVNDFAATQTGVTLDVATLAETVPVGRDQTSLILLAPGTTAGDAGFGNLASIGGATVAENAYYVNGLNITDFRSFLGSSIIPFEFYRTIDVKTGGYQAEYGRALGGVTSAVTRSGSNNLEAGAVLIYSPDGLRSDSPNTYVDADNLAATSGDVIGALNEDDYSNRVEANFYLSGPIIKDRLFFYALYNPRWTKTKSTSSSGGRHTITENNSPFFGGKVDFVITDGHRLEGTYFRDRATQYTNYYEYDAATDSIGASQGGVISEYGGDNFIGSYTGQFSDWLTLSASYGQYNNIGTQVANPDQAYILSRIGGQFVAGGTVTGKLADKDKREIYRADADVYVNFLGEHHFRVGFDLEKLAAEENTTYNGTGYRYDVRSNLNIRYYYNNVGSFKTDQRAFYIQDSWSALDGRLNLQLGVRNDRFQNYTVNGDKYYDSGDLWAPRLGASFDVFGDGRTKIKGYWGRYYLPIATNTNIRLGGAETYYRQIDNYGTSTDADGNGIPDFYTLDANGDMVGFVSNFGGNICPAGSPNAGEICYTVYGDGTLGAVDTLVSASLKPSYTDEFIIGAEHRFGDWRVGINYINRRLGDTLEDAAIDAAVIAYCNANGIAGCASVWSGFHQYTLLNPGSDVTVRLDGDCTIAGQCDVVTLNAADLGYPAATRNYDAIEFEVEKAFNGVYGFTFNYTFTRLRGNFEGGVKSDNNQTDTGLTQDFDQPGFLDGAYGDLANGREHSFKFYGHIMPTDWLDIGVNVVVESPRKFSCIGNYQNDSSTFEYSYGAASYYCRQARFGGDGLDSGPADGTGTGSVLVPRGTAFESDWNKSVDLGFTIAPFQETMPGVKFRVDVFNVFNWKSVLDRNEFGDITQGGVNPNYGYVTGYQAPRSVRLTAFLRFGGDN